MRDIDDSKAPLLDHLVELRKRLLWSVLAIIGAFIAAYTQADKLFVILVHPYAEATGNAAGAQLIYTKLFEAFLVEIKVAFFAAIFIAFPVIANQVWMFIAPGMYRNEKRAFYPFLLATPILFTAGACLAYFVVMPAAFTFLLAQQKSGGGVELNALPAIGDYLALVMQFILAFGVCFLLPVLLMLLERAGIVDRAQLIGGRRYAIVAAFVIAAVLTPPDVISQVMLAVPLMLLYEAALAAMWLTARRRAKTAGREVEVAAE